MRGSPVSMVMAVRADLFRSAYEIMQEMPGKGKGRDRMAERKRERKREERLGQTEEKEQ